MPLIRRYALLTIKIPLEFQWAIDIILGEAWGSHGRERGQGCLLGCDAV